jgi:hypothetical protein
MISAALALRRSAMAGAPLPEQRLRAPRARGWAMTMSDLARARALNGPRQVLGIERRQARRGADPGLPCQQHAAHAHGQRRGVGETMDPDPWYLRRFGVIAAEE